MSVTVIIVVLPVYIFTDLHESCGDYEFACGDGACLLVDHVCHSYHCGATCLCNLQIFMSHAGIMSLHEVTVPVSWETMYVTAIIVVLPVYIFTDLHESCGDYEFA